LFISHPIRFIRTELYGIEIVSASGPGAQKYTTYASLWAERWMNQQRPAQFEDRYALLHTLGRRRLLETNLAGKHPGRAMDGRFRDFEKELNG
jgi:hypothetical protein